MVYAMIIWLVLAISIAWMIYKVISVQHILLNEHQDQQLIRSSVINNAHTKLLFVLAMLWWLVYLVVDVHQMSQTMNLTVTLVMMIGLTPILSYAICYMKCHYINDENISCLSTCTRLGWSLNILTAIIYASLINYSVQLIVMV